MNTKIGGKGTALSSDLFEVWSIRDGQEAYLRLKKGVKEKFTVIPTAANYTGTKVKTERISNYDTSCANKPELYPSMVPIYYKDGNVVKAKGARGSRGNRRTRNK